MNPATNLHNKSSSIQFAVAKAAASPKEKLPPRKRYTHRAKLTLIIVIRIAPGETRHFPGMIIDPS